MRNRFGHFWYSGNSLALITNDYIFCQLFCRQFPTNTWLIGPNLVPYRLSRKGGKHEAIDYLTADAACKVGCPCTPMYQPRYCSTLLQMYHGLVIRIYWRESFALMGLHSSVSRPSWLSQSTAGYKRKSEGAWDEENKCNNIEYMGVYPYLAMATNAPWSILGGMNKKFNIKL